MGGAKIIAFTNQKGGVGKTTSAINVAAYMAAQHGRRVLVVDFDPQGNSTLALGYIPYKLEATIYDAVKSVVEGDSFDASELILDAPREEPIEGLHLIPSNLNLSGAEPLLWQSIGRERILKVILDNVSADYDYVIIDTPPSLGILTINALFATDSVLVPLSTDMFSLSGIPILLKSIENLEKILEKRTEILGYFLTMYEARTKIAREVEEYMRKRFGDLVLETKIPKNVAARESASNGLPLLKYDPDARAARAYRDLTSEILGRLEP